MKLALIGAGQRGMIYAGYAFDHKGQEIVAVVEPMEERRTKAAQRFNIPEKNTFSRTADFFEAGIDCDAVIIASMDRDHYAAAIPALKAGYNLLLEKPISPDINECMEIAKLAKEMNRSVTVCHVLRYTTFFNDIKKILDSKELGNIIAIEHNENVGNFHMAHSFVRGNWRNSEESSPIILQKSCHDMDILTWLAGSNAKRISSFGKLTHFKAENAPEGAAERCYNCPVKDKCHYDAEKAYMPVRGDWPAAMVSEDQSEEGLREALKTSPYGRCVYHCDNDVCDHQLTLIEFENGVEASFVLSGFTNHMCREIKIMCELGEIRADDYTSTIEITRFGSNSVQREEKKVIRSEFVSGFHGGGDSLLMEDFLDAGKGDTDNKTSVDRSIESHLMAYAAEKSRLTGEVIDMQKLKESFK